MKHTYKVYSVDECGTRYCTGKTITADPDRFIWYKKDGIVFELMSLFGFTQYYSYYIPKETYNGYNITYNYLGQGEKSTWFLEKGA